MNFLTNISTQSSSDKELVAAYQQTGNNQWVSTLYQRYMDLVFGVCMKYFKEPERCKDAVMDIFEILVVKLKEHQVENFRGWLGVVARNYCLMQLRSPKTLKTSEWQETVMQSGDLPHLDNEAFNRENSFTQLEQCIETLPNEQKRSIELFYLQKKCYNEIAELTGFDWNKVRSYIQNGKRNLKICIEQQQAVD